MTIHWKAVEQYFTMVLFVFQFQAVCHFEKKYINFGLSTVRIDRVKGVILVVDFSLFSVLEHQDVGIKSMLTDPL